MEAALRSPPHESSSKNLNVLIPQQVYVRSHRVSVRVVQRIEQEKASAQAWRCQSHYQSSKVGKRLEYVGASDAMIGEEPTTKDEGANDGTLRKELVQDEEVKDDEERMVEEEPRRDQLPALARSTRAPSPQEV